MLKGSQSFKNQHDTQMSRNIEKILNKVQITNRVTIFIKAESEYIYWGRLSGKK